MNFEILTPMESLIMSAQYRQLLRKSKSMAITFLMPKMGSDSRVFSASKLIREILSRCATRRNSGFSLKINHLAIVNYYCIKIHHQK
jgi:hypothetical protein